MLTYWIKVIKGVSNNGTANHDHISRGINGHGERSIKIATNSERRPFPKQRTVWCVLCNVVGFHADIGRCESSNVIGLIDYNLYPIGSVIAAAGTTLLPQQSSIVGSALLQIIGPRQNASSDDNRIATAVHRNGFPE